MRQETILVVGGAGYIGSHMVKMLLDQGFRVVTLDSLVSGHRQSVLGGDFVQGDVGDPLLLEHLFTANSFDGVMHFASHIQVGESVADPAKYYLNNVANTLVLLNAMRKHGVRCFIFSSSAAVYGEPMTVPIAESHPKNPINPYGKSKWMIEEVLADYDLAYGLRSVCFRYFNAAGADPGGAIGESHTPETHLIPLVLMAASGRLPQVNIFGEDYDTPDGTCIRDYVHVNDLCQAHLLAMENLLQGGSRAVFNLGNGSGFSVREVINAAEGVTGRKIPVFVAQRRAGDPATPPGWWRMLPSHARNWAGDRNTVISNKSSATPGSGSRSWLSAFPRDTRRRCSHPIYSASQVPIPLAGKVREGNG